MRQKDLGSNRYFRAKRLNLIIKMSGLSHAAFGRKHNIAHGNFQNWCVPRYSGLSEGGAEKCLYGCKMEGIEATLEWLMYGVEPGPIITERFYNKGGKVHLPPKTATTKDSEITAITREILLFRQNYDQQVLEMMIHDNDMEPHYKMGEYVAGKSFGDEDIANLINQDCIVQLDDGTLILRNLKTGSADNLFNLVCTNIHTTNKPVIYDAKITLAAPVMWIRRKAIDSEL